MYYGERETVENFFMTQKCRSGDVTRILKYIRQEHLFTNGGKALRPEILKRRGNTREHENDLEDLFVQYNQAFGAGTNVSEMSHSPFGDEGNSQLRRQRWRYEGVRPLCADKGRG